LKPLRAKAHSFITAEQISQIFSSIEIIYSLNSEVLGKLDKRLKEWPTVTRLGDIFLDFAPMMKIYTEYVNRFDDAVDTLKKLSTKGDKFQEFLRESMKNANSRLDLSSYLIMPVQRLPRYALLLKELIKFTEPTHVDYENLNDAHDKVKEVNTYINKRKQDSDNNNKILAIQDSLVSAVPIVIIAPHRLFIKEAKATVVSENKTVNVQVYIFNDMIVLASAQTHHKTIKYHFEAMIKFNSALTIKDEDAQKFSITSKNDNKTWTFQIADGQKESIMKELKEALDTYELNTSLDDDILANKSGSGLQILSATYGQLARPNRSKDVTAALQQIVQQQSGTLTLRAESKTKLPGFGDPAKKKEKSLLIVYSENGTIKTSTFRDNDAVNLGST